MVETDALSHPWQKFLEREYEFQIERVKSYTSLYRSQAAARVDTNQGSYVFKQYRGSAEDLRTLWKRIEFLRKQGCRTAPVWLKTKSGDAFVRFHNHLFYGLSWVEGRPYEANTDQSLWLGETLADLHDRTITTNALFGTQLLEQRTRRLARATTNFRRLLKQTEKNAATTWLNDHRDICEQWLELTEQELNTVLKSRQSGELRSVLVHGDVTAPNVIAHEQGVSLIDWERLGPGLRMEEVAKTVANTCMFQPHLIEQFLSGYKIVLRSPLEKTLFRAFFRVPREALYLADALKRRANDDFTKQLFQVLVENWVARVDAVRWVDTHIVV